jgi:hypothetical protein
MYHYGTVYFTKHFNMPESYSTGADVSEHRESKRRPKSLVL